MIPILDWDGVTGLLRRETREAADVREVVSGIIADVRARGDAALREYTRKYDGVRLNRFQVTPEELEAAYDSLDEGFRWTLMRSSENIERFHARQLPRDYVSADTPGTVMGLRYLPVEKVGICVPRSPNAFPSTILMNVIPARIAGVREIVVATPPDRNGRISPEALGAAYLAAENVTVLKIGGAQAVAALAFGTESVPAVDKIVGPGGIYIAEAKRQVYGQTGIDLIAGPSEILVLADGESDPRYIAADLLSQAEHDTHAAAVLVTDSRKLARETRVELLRQLEKLPRREIARRSLQDNGRIFVTDSLTAAVEAANRIAPEHLELCVSDPFALLPLVKNAGSVFLGRSAPEALGDYYAGPNHTLPTGGAARFAGPLSVTDFMKPSSFLYYSPEALAKAADGIADFAEREGLRAHARSVLIRNEGGTA